MTWEIKPISSFCQTGSGSTPSRRKQDRYYGGSLSWVKSGELRENVIASTEETLTEMALAETAVKMVPKGSLLVAMYGATVGRIAELGIDATTNQAVCHIIPDNSMVTTKYLYYALQSKVPEWIDRRVGGAQPNISQQIIRQTEIPLPPLSEQKRIAAILDKADAIRQKRQQAIKLTDQFLKSLFIDMFGDPVTNPKGWERGRIRDLVDKVQYGTSKKAGTTGALPMLRMNNITVEGDWDLENLKFIDFDDNEREKYLVHKGDLLFNRTNSKELVGKTAVFNEVDPMVFAGYLIRAQTNNRANPEYISGYLNSKHGKMTLVNMCKSIIGMANINAQELQDIRIMIPPVGLQHEFSRIVEASRVTKSRYLKSSDVKNDLFNSLVQRGFRGEL